MTPNLTKVVVIAATWTSTLLLAYVSTYLLIGDLVGLGKLSGTYEFWPDFIGNALIGAAGGLLGGALLVYKLNAAYKHSTFFSSIAHSVTWFLLVFVGSQVVLLFSMPFALDTARGGLVSGLRGGVRNLDVNLGSPTFVANVVFVGLIVASTQFMLQVNDKFERIGHKRFFELLRELFQDVTRPVVEGRGDIYQYVGDEVVITWPVQRGVEDGNCIECFCRIERAITAKRDRYVREFGVAPTFKAGVPVGEAA